MKYSQYNLICNDKTSNRAILFNTLTGHSFYITDDIVEMVKQGDVSSLDESTRNLFVRHGILINDNVDELRYFSYYHNKSKFSSDTVSATVLLTWACNFSCVYCFEGAGNVVNSMSEADADRFVLFMKRSASEQRARNMHITLFGGEPLVNIKRGFYILEKLNAYCVENGMRFTCGIVTNGSLFTQEIIEQLIKYNCISVQVTLDGTQEIHDKRRPYKNGLGSFYDIINSLKMLENYYHSLRTVIRINVDKANIEETKKLLFFLGKDGINLTKCGVDFGIVRGSTAACSAYSGNCFSDHEIGDLLERLWLEAENQGFSLRTLPMQRWMYCGLYSDNQYTITPDCGVYKCWEHAGIEEHLMGRLDENGAIINMQFAFFNWMSKNPLENSQCRECVYLPACGGGCGVISYNESGDYHSSGCFKVKGVLEKQIQRFAVVEAQKRN